MSNVNKKWELNVGQQCALGNLGSSLWEMSATLHLVADKLCDLIDEGNDDVLFAADVIRGAAGRAARLSHKLTAVLDALEKPAHEGLLS
jgi:hypothetical protein